MQNSDAALDKEERLKRDIKTMINTPLEVTKDKRDQEIQEQAAAIRTIERPEGRYSINEAVILLLAETGEYFRVGKATWNGDLRSYAPGSIKPVISAGNNPKDWMKYDDAAEILWSDLNDWLAKNYPLVKFRFPKGKAKQGTSQSSDDWKDKARAIADKLALERHQRGEREITARNISDAVATELAKDSTTHGTRGERSGGNIRNLALKGWKFIPPTGTNGTSGTKK